MLYKIHGGNMTIVKNALTALDDLKNIFDLTSVDYDYYEELKALCVEEKNARIRAIIRGLLTEELEIERDFNEDNLAILDDLIFDEYCLIKNKTHSSSFKRHNVYTRLLHNSTLKIELYEKFGCFFMLDTKDIENISNSQIKSEYERRFGKSEEPEEINLDLDDEDDLDLDLDSEDDLDLYSDDELDLDTDDLDLDGDDELDLDSDDELVLEEETNHLGISNEDAKQLLSEFFDETYGGNVEQKKRRATTDLVISRLSDDVANLDDDYFSACLDVVKEYHRDNQMVEIPLHFFPLVDFDVDPDYDVSQDALEITLSLLTEKDFIHREMIDGKWHYALTEHGKSMFVDDIEYLAPETSKKNVGVIYFRDNNTFQPIVKHEYKKGDVSFYINGKAFSFESFDEIYKIIVMLDEAQQQGLTRVEINAVDIYVGALSNHLKSHYIDSKVIEEKFINFIKAKLGDKKERQITLSTFADALTFGSIDKTNKVLRRLLKKKMIKRRQKIEGSAYTYSLGKGDKLDFNIDF